MTKPDCPHFNQCQITNIRCKPKVTSNLQNYHGKIYCGISKGAFKQPKTLGRLSAILNFEKIPTNKKKRYLLFMSEWKTFHH